MIENGYLKYLLPADENEALAYWDAFLGDAGSWHPLASMSRNRLKKTIPIVLYGDEGSNKNGQNGFMLGTWMLELEIRSLWSLVFCINV